MAKEDTYMFDVATLFHSLLFAYEKAVKNVLGSGAAIFVHPTLEYLKKIDEEKHLNLISSGNLNETWNNLSNFFLKANVVKTFTFKKVEGVKYLLMVDGCIWAKHIHKELKPKDVTCPYALIAMAAFEKLTGKKVKVNDSKYFEEGTETTIEPL